MYRLLVNLFTVAVVSAVIAVLGAIFEVSATGGSHGLGQLNAPESLQEFTAMAVSRPSA